VSGCVSIPHILYQSLELLTILGQHLCTCGSVEQNNPLNIQLQKLPEG
jgi:hypothetical protein